METNELDHFKAPELHYLGENLIGKEMDIFSCGVILFTMVTGYFPFKST